MTTREKNQKEWQEQAIAEAFEDLLDDIYFEDAVEHMDEAFVEAEYQAFVLYFSY